MTVNEALTTIYNLVSQTNGKLEIPAEDESGKKYTVRGYKMPRQIRIDVIES